MNKENSKIKMLAIERMFQTKRHLSMRDIIDTLERRYDIKADRRTVYDDIACLTMFMNIQTEGGGRYLRYYLAEME